MFTNIKHFFYFNRNHPVVYLMLNKMVYCALTQLQYISFLATCFGFFLQSHLQAAVVPNKEEIRE